jgi:hypothetical protein
MVEVSRKIRRWLAPCLLLLVLGVTCASFWIVDSRRSQTDDWRKELVIGKLKERHGHTVEIQLQKHDIDTYLGTGWMLNGQSFSIMSTFDENHLSIETSFSKVADPVPGIGYIMGDGHSFYPIDWTVTHSRFIQFIRLIDIGILCFGVVFPLLGLFRLRRTFALWLKVALFFCGMLNLFFLFHFIPEFISHL